MKIDVHSSRTSTQSNQYSSQLNFPIFPRSSGTSSISLFNTPHHHHRAVMICGQAVQQWFVQQAHLQAQFNVIFKTDHLLPWAASGKTMPGIRESTTARNNRPSAITRIYPSIGSISFPFFPCCILSAMFPMIFCFLGYKAYERAWCLLELRMNYEATVSNFYDLFLYDHKSFLIIFEVGATYFEGVFISFLWTPMSRYTVQFCLCEDKKLG